MKKRPAKKLLRCDACGKSGFINLKSHRCKAAAKPEASEPTFELMPSQADALKQIEHDLTPVMHRVSRKTEDLLYDIVLAGLFLMKAQDVHRVSTVGHAADGTFDGSAADEGFRGWLATAYPDLSRASAYNYINGAKNCGLTVRDGASAIERLRAAHALAGKTAGDLYRLKDRDDAANEDGSASNTPKHVLVRDTAVSLREACENAVAIRDSLNKKAFQTFCARIHRTLEDMSGSQWDIVPERKREPFKEHGDIYEIGS